MSETWYVSQQLMLHGRDIQLVHPYASSKWPRKLQAWSHVKGMPTCVRNWSSRLQAWSHIKSVLFSSEIFPRHQIIDQFSNTVVIDLPNTPGGHPHAPFCPSSCMSCHSRFWFLQKPCGQLNFKNECPIMLDFCPLTHWLMLQRSDWCMDECNLSKITPKYPHQARVT